MGVEKGREQIEIGKEYLRETEFSGPMEFVNEDAFDLIVSAKRAQFDTALCFGFLYHTVKQVEFFRQIGRLVPDNLIINTKVAKRFCRK